jgi:DNA topoisomerase-2
MDKLDKDTVDLLSRRAYDIAGCGWGVKVILNGKKIAVKGFKDYCQEYVGDREDKNGEPLKLVYEKFGTRWEVACTVSDTGFQQVSFVNSIATTKGGRHVDYITDQVAKSIVEVVNKKNTKGKGKGMAVKPFQVKQHLFIFVNCLIVNPTFDSQTKETMTLQSKSFGSKCDIPDKFVTAVSKTGIVDAVLIWAKFKELHALDSKTNKRRQNQIKGVPKLDDANWAGGPKSLDCSLILTEGDSAKALAVSGLSVIGRDRFGVFPLKGKQLAD